MIAAVLGGLVALARPGAAGGELLLGVGLTAVVLLVAAVLAAMREPTAEQRHCAPARFDRVRVLLRASDPDAPGHQRARAPGFTG